MKVCIVGASGKLGRYMVQHCLDRGYEVVGVCREQSVPKLDMFKDKMTIFPGMTNDREVIQQAVKGCDGVCTVLAPWGVQDYSSGTAKAVMDFAEPHARLIFSCGWHISRDGKDTYGWVIRFLTSRFVVGFFRMLRLVDLDDQVRAAQAIFASDTKWTLVRGSSLEEGPSEGLPVWSRHAGDRVLESDITRRVDFALFMVDAMTNDDLIHELPAIVSCASESATKWAHEAGLAS